MFLLYAKYTSTVTGSDTARVAKWSFDGADLTNKTVTFGLFDTINDTGNTADETDVADNLIAPGTAGTAKFSLQNTGEVTAKATVTFKVTNANNIPVKFYAGTSTEALKGTTNEDGTITYELDEVTLAMNATDATNVTLNWEWPFEVGSDSTTPTLEANDKADTTLGIGGTATITVEVTVVFTQVD